MTIINHSEALRLEDIVCNVYNCGRCGIGGLASADKFENYICRLKELVNKYY